MSKTTIWATYERAVAEAIARHQYSKASTILKEALYNANGKGTEIDPKLVTSADEMATFHFRNGEFNRSASIYRVLLEVQQKSLGAEHPQTARTLAALREVLGAAGSMSPRAYA